MGIQASSGISAIADRTEEIGDRRDRKVGPGPSARRDDLPSVERRVCSSCRSRPNEVMTCRKMDRAVEPPRSVILPADHFLSPPQVTAIDDQFGTHNVS